MCWFDSIYCGRLPSRVLTLYLYLGQRAKPDGQCWPSERRIAMDLSLSKSTVKRAIADLVQNGDIQVEQRYRRSEAKSSLLFTISDFKKRRTAKG